MRLFVAVWPPPGVVEVLAGLQRPHAPGVRWTGPDQWHVTLRFLGPLEDAGTTEVAHRLARLAAGPAEATLGPTTQRLGRSVLVIPVGGLDPLAAAVAGATSGLGQAEARPFWGHLTLARARGRGRRAEVPASLAGAEVEGRWRVEEVALVRSHLRAHGARYEIVAKVALA
ncbi:MAG: RNA 2',3'-cyclic phosphodiesterase [Acidimicrobiales bacterium]